MESIPHTLCIFKNEKLRLFHIWQTKQEKVKQNVSVVNAFSKAQYALTGKDSAQPGATTSFFRILPNTEQKDWVVDYVKLDEVTKEELKESYEIYSNLLEEEGYRCITRDPKVRLQSGRYAGRKWSATKIQNLKYVQIKKYAMSMLEDCFFAGDNINAEANIVARSVVSIDSEIENISQMWRYVFFKYSEKT